MPHYMNEDRELIRNIAREFTEKEVKPVAGEIDKDDKFPVELFRRCGELGFTSVNVSEEYGGSGIDLTSFSLVIEEISKESATLAMCIIGHAALAATVINDAGTEEQKKRWLPPLVSGKSIGAYCMTEPTGNADPSMYSCTAVKDGKEWVINGTKVFCTNIGVADYYIVLTVTGEFNRVKKAGRTFFMVEKNTPGFSIGKIEDKFGLRGSNTGTIYFKNVRVPEENMIGPFNSADSVAPQTLYYEMTVAGASALGIAERAYEKALNFSLARTIKTGTPYYYNFQLVRGKLTEMKMDIEAMRSFIYDQTTSIDNGEINIPVAILVKPYCYRKAEMICSLAIDLHGGIGVVKEAGVERLWRDAKIGMIAGGQYDYLIDVAGKVLGAAGVSKKLKI